MNLGDFHALVRDHASLGTRLDGVVPGAVRQAAAWFEQNHTFQYMRRYYEFVLPQSTKEPRAVPLPCRPKALIALRRVDENGSLYRIDRASPHEVRHIKSGVFPTRYWMDGVDYLWFDSEPESEITLNLVANIFSEWPGADNASHWLLDNAELFMLGQSMLNLAPYARKPEWIGMYEKMRNEALRALVVAEDSLAIDGRGFEAGRYIPEGLDDPRL